MRPSPRHARLAAILASGWFNLACDRKPDPDRVDRRDSVNGLAPIDSVIGADNAGGPISHSAVQPGRHCIHQRSR